KISIENRPVRDCLFFLVEHRRLQLGDELGRCQQPVLSVIQELPMTGKSVVITENFWQRLPEFFFSEANFLLGLSTKVQRSPVKSLDNVRVVLALHEVWAGDCY